jgi:MFS family permease
MMVEEPQTHVMWLEAHDRAPMGVWQVVAAAVCILVNVLDGFDILIMSVAAPSIAAALQLSTLQIGLMFSSGLLGMMVGAVLLPALADRLGRRTIILVCLSINIIGLFCTGLSQNVLALLLFRFVTGLGVGGMMPTLNTAIAELTNARSRYSAIIIQAAAYPAGGLAAAVMWASMSQNHGWHELIQTACLPSALCFGLVVFLLPESVPFLLTRRPPNSLERVNQTLKRFGHPIIAALTGEPDRKSTIAGKTTFDKAGRQALIVFSAATFLTQFSFYFFVSWIPVVMATSLATGNVQRSGPILLNLGGIIGDFVYAGLTTRISVRRSTSAMMVLAFVNIAVLGQCMNKSLLTLSIAGLVGAALFAAMAGIYCIAPTLFTPLNRATGTGVAFSIGRLGGALSPWLGAMLLTVPGMRLEYALLLMAAPLLAASATLAMLRQRLGGR